MRRLEHIESLRNDKKRIGFVNLLNILCIFAPKQKCVMRHPYYLLLIITLVSCNHSSNYHQQLEQAELIIEDHPDSAKAIIQEIPTSLLGKEERALHNLLLTMVNYKLYKPFTDDSLIKNSVDYYEKKSIDKERLANAYYYISAINYDELGQKEQSVNYLKKAEDLALKLNNELLTNKINELFQGINYDCHNYQLALQYSEKLLKSSEKLNAPNLLARSYNHLSCNYLHLGQKGKSDSCIQKSLSYIEKCDNRGKGNLYGDYANYLMGESLYSEAKQYLIKAIQAHPFPNHYIMLGKIAKIEGDTLQARLHWEKAMTFDNQRFAIKAYKLLGEMYAEQHRYPLAFQMMEKADSANDAWHEQMRTAQLTEIQHRYDAAILEKALTERKNLWLTIATIALVVLVLALMTVVYFSKKVKEYKGIINEDIEQIYQAEQKIELLQSTGEDSERKMTVLKEQIKRFKESSAQRLGRGKTIYESIVNDEKIHELTRAREQDLIDYYAYTFSKQFHALILPYQKLTLRHTTYLVMQQMGVDDRKIAEILNVTDSTIRNYRHRLKDASK